MNDTTQAIRDARRELRHAERSRDASVPGSLSRAAAHERLEAAWLRYQVLTGHAACRSGEPLAGAAAS
jgi:hypothetical protein